MPPAGNGELQVRPETAGLWAEAPRQEELGPAHSAGSPGPEGTVWSRLPKENPQGVSGSASGWGGHSPTRRVLKSPTARPARGFPGVSVRCLGVSISGAPAPAPLPSWAGPHPQAPRPAARCAPGRPAAPRASAGHGRAPAHTPHTGCPRRPRCPGWLVALWEHERGAHLGGGQGAARCPQQVSHQAQRAPSLL